MPEHIIAFLGAGKYDPLEGYRTANYLTDDGVTFKTSLFADALLRWRQRVAPGKVQRVTILGTRTSSWGALVAATSQDKDFLLDTALESERPEGISDQKLQHVEGSLHEHLSTLVRKKVDVLLKCIPWGLNRDEQGEILAAITSRIRSTDVVWFDVTHGFRHLPMVGLIAALHAQRVKGASLGGILYGALEARSNEITPAVSLDGLVDTLDALIAAEALQASGNVGAFTKTLQDKGVILSERAPALRRAAYAASNNALDSLKVDDIRSIRSTISHIESQKTSPFALVSVIVKRALAWISNDSLSSRQLSLACDMARRMERLSAAALLYEGLVSRECERLSLDPQLFDMRDKAKQSLLNGRDTLGTTGSDLDKVLISTTWTFRVTNAIRNQLVHGAKNESTWWGAPKAVFDRLLADDDAFLVWVQSVAQQPKIT